MHFINYSSEQQEHHCAETAVYLKSVFILNQDGHCWACIKFRQQGWFDFVPPPLLDIARA